jgi:hypothetical protein
MFPEDPKKEIIDKFLLSLNELEKNDLITFNFLDD